MASEPVSEFVRRRPAPPLRPFVVWYSGYRESGVAPALHRGLFAGCAPSRWLSDEYRNVQAPAGAVPPDSVA